MVGMKNIFEQLTDLLKKDERLMSQDGALLKNQAQELARKNDAGLLKLLLSDKAIKQHFFFEVEKTLIFDKEKFIRFISNKQFLPDSYTSFKNKIGLTSGADFLSENKEVVLVWPYKDCVLEGGMTKEDQKRDEIFYNETLAPDDITWLLDLKVFTNFKRVDGKGEHKLDGFKRDEKGLIKDNLIIKGNNLLALASLKKEFAGKVKLIYIDPPYNTGNDGFKYNDSFNHSLWLTFMKNRLEIAKQLLSDDGSIYLQLDYNEIHYCKILMDEVFGKNNFQREIIWKLGGLAGYKSLVNSFVRGHETILFYSKTQNSLFNKIYLPYGEEQLKRFSSIDEEGKRYKTITKDKRLYLDNAKGIPISDLWDDIASFQTVVNSREIMNFEGQKPEKLLQRIIESSSNQGDIVLDYHAGTGTTLAVAHKTGRQYIGIEQMDYIHDLPESRLKKVIAGEQGGISKDVNWQGGGDFVYMELMEWNEKIVKEVREAKTEKELDKIWNDFKDNTFLSWRIDTKIFDEKAKDFADLNIFNKKKFLIECLDKNQLYVNLSEIEDKEYEINGGDIKLNREFYE
jgi:adenine-specific DNA-methyltransferase